MQNAENTTQILPWRLYLTTTFETLIAFYIATFSLAMFFSHRGPHWLFLGAMMGILYLFAVAACAIRIASKLPLQALMIIIPVAPFVALAIVLSLVPTLQFF